MLNASVPEQQIHFWLSAVRGWNKYICIDFAYFIHFSKYILGLLGDAVSDVWQERKPAMENVYTTCCLTHNHHSNDAILRSLSLPIFPRQAITKNIYSIRKLWMQSATYISIESFKFPLLTLPLLPALQNISAEWSSLLHHINNVTGSISDPRQAIPTGFRDFSQNLHVTVGAYFKSGQFPIY
jgi:hypothetical protein